MNRLVAIYLLILPLLVTISTGAKAFESDLDSGIVSSAFNYVTLDLGNDSPQPDLDITKTDIRVGIEDRIVGLEAIEHPNFYRTLDFFGFIGRAPPRVI